MEIIYLSLAGLLCLCALALNLLLCLCLLCIAARAAADHACSSPDCGTFTGITGDGSDQRTSSSTPNRTPRSGTLGYLAGLLLRRLGLSGICSLLVLDGERVTTSGIDRPLVTLRFVF